MRVASNNQNASPQMGVSLRKRKESQRSPEAGEVRAMQCSSLGRVRLFATPWTAAHQAPLSMGFSRKEHWSGLPCPPPGDRPSPGTEPVSLASLALVGGCATIQAFYLELPPPCQINDDSPSTVSHFSLVTSVAMDFNVFPNFSYFREKAM